MVVYALDDPKRKFLSCEKRAISWMVQEIALFSILLQNATDYRTVFYTIKITAQIRKVSRNTRWKIQKLSQYFWDDCNYILHLDFVHDSLHN